MMAAPHARTACCLPARCAALCTPPGQPSRRPCGLSAAVQWRGCAAITADAARNAAPQSATSLDLKKRGRKSEYIRFMKAATGDRNSREHKQMNQFLVRCFLCADADFTGKVTWDEFDLLVDRAIATPRYFGIIDSNAEKFATVEEMKADRLEMFRRIDRDNHGFIRLHDWLHFYFEYFGAELQSFEESVARSKMHASRKDFARFMIAAARSRSSFEYKELYRFLTYCFLAADTDQSGCIAGEEFDVMIDLATEAPRKFGFAPPSSIFKDEEQRLKSRNDLLQTIIDGTSDEDRVSFDRWIDYCYRHICQKARMLDRRLTGVAPPPVREGVEWFMHDAE